MENLGELFNIIKGWAENKADIKAVLLVGSHARNEATKTSDVDLIFIVDKTHKYLDGENWIKFFGNVIRIENEDWGPLKTKRVFFEIHGEVEFNFTTAKWLKVNPSDNGTIKVLSDGYKIILDRNGLVRKFVLFIEQ